MSSGPVDKAILGTGWYYNQSNEAVRGHDAGAVIEAFVEKVDKIPADTGYEYPSSPTVTFC